MKVVITDTETTIHIGSLTEKHHIVALDVNGLPRILGGNNGAYDWLPLFRSVEQERLPSSPNIKTAVVDAIDKWGWKVEVFNDWRNAYQWITDNVPRERQDERPTPGGNPESTSGN